MKWYNQNILNIYRTNTNWKFKLEQTQRNVSNRIVKNNSCIQDNDDQKRSIAVSDENKSELYYAFIYSKIQYGIETHGQAKASPMQKLHLKQSKSIKILHNLRYNANYSTTQRQTYPTGKDTTL